MTRTFAYLSCTLIPCTVGSKLKDKGGKQSISPLSRLGLHIYETGGGVLQTDSGKIQELDLENDGKLVRFYVLNPEPNHIAPDPLLLISLAKDGISSLTQEPYATIPQAFVAKGHRAASFDLPSHGQRIDEHGEALIGLRNAYLSGHDPFSTCVHDARILINHGIDTGLARPGRIAVTGTSRGGYMAMRILAAEARVAAAAAMSPVTDWRHLDEFSGHVSDDCLARLQLDCFAAQMAARHVLLVIGGADDRVGTDKCVRLYDQLTQINEGQDGALAQIMLQVTDDPGHTLSVSRHTEAARFLLNVLDLGLNTL